MTERDFIHLHLENLPAVPFFLYKYIEIESAEQWRKKNGIPLLLSQRETDSNNKFPDEKAKEKRTENQTLFDAFVEERTFLNWQSEGDLSADIRQRRFVTKTFAKEILVFLVYWGI